MVLIYLSRFPGAPNCTFLEPILGDLDRLYELRFWIPDPNEPVSLEWLRSQGLIWLAGLSWGDTCLIPTSWSGCSHGFIHFCSIHVLPDQFLPQSMKCLNLINKRPLKHMFFVSFSLKRIYWGDLCPYDCCRSREVFHNRIELYIEAGIINSIRRSTFLNMSNLHFSLKHVLPSFHFIPCQTCVIIHILPFIIPTLVLHSTASKWVDSSSLSNIRLFKENDGWVWVQEKKNQGDTINLKMERGTL